jgi:hypothetical protein
MPGRGLEEAWTSTYTDKRSLVASCTLRRSNDPALEPILRTFRASASGEVHRETLG